MKTILSAALAVTLALSAMEAGAQDKAAHKKVELAIEQQSLADALNEWAKQTGLQLVSSSSEMMNTTVAPGIRGAYTAKDALEELLRGTSLTYEWVGERAVAIREKQLVVPAALQTTGESERVEVPRLQLANLAAQGDAQGGGAEPRAGRRDRGGTSREQEVEEVEEIVVTGTYIRGARPVGSAVISIDRERIEESGSVTLADYMRKLPQNFANADSAGFVGAVGGGSDAANNSGRASTLNLRGLGPDATLVLLNGERIAPGGSAGEFVDVSMIPLSALDRVEVLTDGASAVYGSDAIAGVVNFVLRRDLHGAETTARYGADSDGDAAERTITQTFGRTWSDGNVIGVYEYHDQDAVQASDRDFVPEQSFPVDLLPEQERHSVLLAGNLLVGATSVGIEGYFSDRDFAQTYPDLINAFDVQEHGSAKGYGAAISATHDLSADWRGELAGSYSRGRDERRSTFAGGDPLDLENESEISSASIRANGPLFGLPGGDLRVSLGADFRQESFENEFASADPLDRDVYGVYAEVLAPLVGADNRAPGLHRLELSAAIRYDDYSDVGSSTNPRFGVVWSPVEALSIRASYAESFRAPVLAQLAESTDPYFTFEFPDPDAADGSTVALVYSGGSNPALEPERAKSFTLGFDVQAGAFELSTTYFNIDFSDRISFPPFVGSFFDIFFQQDTLASFFDLNPALVDVEEVFATRTVVDIAGLGPSGVEAIFDSRPHNVARSKVSGFDLMVSNTIDRGSSSVELFVNANYLLELDSRPTPTAAAVELVDTTHNPTSLKLRTGATWSVGPLAATAILNYQNSYDNTLTTPATDVDSWLTADLHFSYDWRKTRLALTVQNITDEDPPALLIDSTGLLNIGYDAANASPLGRFVALTVRQSW